MSNGEASIWNPRTLLQLSADTKRIEEKLTAIAGQTLFTLKDFTYVVDTGSLAIYLLTAVDAALDVKGGRLLKEGVDWAEGTVSTFSIVVPLVAGDQITAVGYVAITGNVDIRDTDIFVSNYQAIRDYAGTEITLYAQGKAVHADQGENFFNKVTGAGAGTHVDNNENVIIPTGGDGSIAWIRRAVENSKLYPLTVAAMIADTRFSVTDVGVSNVKTKGFLSGNAGGGIYDIILGIATDNGIDKIKHATANITFVLRYTDQVSLLQLGAAEDAVGDGVEAGTTDDTAVVTYAATLGIKIIVSDKCMVAASMPTAASSQFIGVLHQRISQFVVEPVTKVNNLFDIIDGSNVSFNKIGFISNNLGDGAGEAGAIRFAGVAAAMDNLKVTECYFENFIHNYWIYFNNNDAGTTTTVMSNLVASKNKFVSKTGNDIDNTNIGVPATCIAFQGSLRAESGRIEKLEANNNEMDCSHMKRGIDVWGNCHGGELAHNHIDNAGLNGNDDTATYAILMYSNRFLIGAVTHAYDPSGIEAHGNIINDPRDTGFYVQSFNDSSIHDNIIRGQTSTADGTIPKGAIALNAPDNFSVYSNTLYDNAIDIGSTNINSKNDREIINNVYENKCLSDVADNVRITGNTTSSLAGFKSTLNFIDNIVKGNIIAKFGVGGENFDLNIKGGQVKGSALNGIFIFEVASFTPAIPININIENVALADIVQDAVSYTADWANVTIKACRLDMGTITRHGINLSNSKNAQWIDNVFWTSKDVAVGDTCVNVTSAEHLSHGNTMEGIDAANKQTGFVAPTWSGHEGERVQTLRSSEQGSASSKYVLKGYVNTTSSTTWVEERVLTGN